MVVLKKKKKLTYDCDSIISGSGNTLLRNILYEVYGIESSTYLINPNQIQDENFSKYPL
jgi:hypothetical protein